MKKEVKKPVKVAPIKGKTVKKEFTPKVKVVEPLRVQTIKSNYVPVKEKVEYKIMPITHVICPEGYVRSIVLIPYAGMLDNHNVGDIVDLPERRYKSLVFRGVVKEYKGELLPNKRR